MRRTELRSIRSRLGLKQKAMAERLGIDPRQLRRYEHGERPITILIEYAVRWLEHIEARRR